MGFYKAISVLALGIGSYALYKTGALRPVTKAAVCAGVKISEWTDEKMDAVKEKSKVFCKKVSTNINELKEEIQADTENCIDTNSKE